MIAALAILSVLVLVLLPIALVQRACIAELKAERDAARQAATDWMEIAERKAHPPRGRHNARWSHN